MSKFNTVTVNHRNTQSEFVLFEYHNADSRYDRKVVGLPLELLETAYSVCCTPLVHLDKDGKLVIGRGTTDIWQREELRAINEKGFHAEMCNGTFVGLVPLTEERAREILAA